MHHEDDDADYSNIKDGTKTGRFSSGVHEGNAWDGVANPYIDSITRYASLANRTLAEHVRSSRKETILNAAMGLASETGEINEIIKKLYFHDHPPTDAMRDHLKKELGDLAWYWALMCYGWGFDPANVLGMNIEKLKARYPEGFSTERSMNRKAGDI